MHDDKRPKCINYGCTESATYSSTTKTGRKRWRVHCSHCQSASWGKHPHRPGVTPYKTGKCCNQDGRLGFTCPTDYSPGSIAWGKTQVDHIDGDHTNNDHSNLQELCQDCHLEKSMQEGNLKGHRYPQIEHNEVDKIDEWSNEVVEPKINEPA